MVAGGRCGAPAQAIVSAEGVQTDAFKINTGSSPSYRFGSESFGENANWNKRLLLMMDRARSHAYRWTDP